MSQENKGEHVLMKGMHKMTVCRVDGINCPIFSFTESGDYHRQFKLIQSVKLRDDDVIMCGYPRCGNNWTYETIHMIRNQTTEYTNLPFYAALLEFMGERVQENIDSRKSPRTICMHSVLKYLPKEVLDRKLKIIYSIRNPKDCFVSFYKLSLDMKSPKAQFVGTFSDYFECELANEMFWGGALNHLKEFEEFRRKNPHIPIFIRHFEKVKENPLVAIEDLCTFLEVPKSKAKEICEAVSMEKMKANTEEKQKLFKAHQKEGATGLIDKGNTGNWKHFFTVEQSERFDAMFEKYLSGTEVGNLLRPYLS